MSLGLNWLERKPKRATRKKGEEDLPLAVNLCEKIIVLSQCGRSRPGIR
jgi:hypothetical protein